MKKGLATFGIALCFGGAMVAGFMTGHAEAASGIAFFAAMACVLVAAIEFRS